MEQQQLSTPPPIVSTSVKLVLGLFFATLGVVMTLDNLNLFDPYPYLRYWPVIFIVVGALKIGDVTSRGMAIASIVAGVVLLSWTTRWLRFSVFDYAGGAPSGGRIYLYSGKDGRLLKTYTSRINGDTLGFDAVGIGDVDGDGIVDLLVASAWSGIHGNHSGRVFIISSGVK